MQNNMVDAFNNWEKYDANFPLYVYTKCLKCFYPIFILFVKKKENK
jgi:hypothetical protein